MITGMPSIARRSMETRPGRWADYRRDARFLTTLAILFIASVWGTVRLCSAMPGGGMPMPGGWTMSMMWMRMPGQSWPGAALSFLWMWTVMMAAMMLPCLTPMLLAYRRTTGSSNADFRTACVGLGYFLVWTLFGLVAYVAGVIVADAQMRSSALSTATPAAAALIVLAAGIAQFLPTKRRLLDRCHPGDGCCNRPAPGAFCHGLRIGIDCAACCFGYMLILLVTDIMSPVLMAVVTIAIAAERLLPKPILFARLGGVGAIAAGLWMLARAG